MARRDMRRVRGLASTINYDRNDGRPGVVYVLANAAFRDDWCKIGQSSRSGHHRASDLNVEAGTGTPKHFHCVFESPTKCNSPTSTVIALRSRPQQHLT